jgi:hypothetical protein
MSLLKLNVESASISESFINRVNLRIFKESNGNFVKIVSPLLLIFSLNEIRPQIVLADQLPKKDTLITRDYTYSNDCYYCFEKPILTGGINNQLIQLRTYIKNKEIVFLSKYRFTPEVVKYDMEMAEFKIWEKRLLRQLQRGKK